MRPGGVTPWRCRARRSRNQRRCPTRLEPPEARRRPRLRVPPVRLRRRRGGGARDSPRGRQQDRRPEDRRHRLLLAPARDPLPPVRVPEDADRLARVRADALPPPCRRLREPARATRDEPLLRTLAEGAHRRRRHVRRRRALDREAENVYRRRFEELYGPLRDEGSRGRRSQSIRLERAHKLQVLVATLLIALGWTFVVQPESVFGRSFTPGDFQLQGLPSIPSSRSRSRFSALTSSCSRCSYGGSSRTT